MSEHGTEVIVLCGGLGTRFRVVDPVGPKALALVANRPFLDILLDQFFSAGYRKFILCVGYGAEAIKNYVIHSKFNAYTVVSREDVPLGTGGALKLAENLIQGDHFFVINGDSYCDIDLRQMEKNHRDNPNASVTLALTCDPSRSDAGTVLHEEITNRIISFQEKNSHARHEWINAGIYVCDRTLLNAIHAGKKVSLEYDVFPHLVNKGLYGVRHTKPVIDIGTKERYNNAQEYFKKKENIV